MTELRWLARTAMLRVRDMSRLALLLAVSVVILSFNFGSRLLLTNDDTRFPVMARDVLAHGHWLLPALPDGQPHLAKPPLVVWLMTLASWPTGSVSVRTAVLPSLLEALGVVLVTYWIGRRLFNPNVGLVGGLVTFTTVGVFSLAHSAMPDMALLLALTSAMAAYVAMEFDGLRTWLIAFYALVGLASLAKGAAGLLPLAIVLVYTIVTDGVSRLTRVVSVPGLVVLVLLAVPWWILAALAGRERFVEGLVVLDTGVAEAGAGLRRRLGRRRRDRRRARHDPHPTLQRGHRPRHAACRAGAGPGAPLRVRRARARPDLQPRPSGPGDQVSLFRGAREAWA